MGIGLGGQGTCIGSPGDEQTHTTRFRSPNDFAAVARQPPWSDAALTWQEPDP
ncbi:MAG: hypothetical protein ACHQZQ_05285 [SAR324 cluster bacterium]